MSNKYNNNDLLFFLNYGFLPSVADNASSLLFPDNDLSSIQKIPEAIQQNEQSLIRLGIEALDSAFSNIGDGRHIVPLSGGLDSRVVIAGLLKAGLKDQITTVSFGVPGAFDFEIASMLAKKLGIRHDIIDLSTIAVDELQLIERAQQGSSWTLLLDGFYNALICQKYGKEATYWSGFMGGELAGSHLPRVEHSCWDDAKEYFLNWNALHKYGGFNPSSVAFSNLLPSKPLFDPSVISYDDQLDFFVRQVNYIQRAITFEGYQYRSPFLAKECVNFFLGVNREHRQDKNLFKKVITSAYPEIFALPTANNFGGATKISSKSLALRRVFTRLRREINDKAGPMAGLVNPVFSAFNIYNRVNYINFDEVVRSRSDFKELIDKSVTDFDQRNLLEGIDGRSLLDSHCSKKGNHGLPLMLLNALEISLKATD